MLTEQQIKKGMCAPTIIAIALAVMALLGNNTQDKVSMLVAQMVLVALIFTLCYYGYTKSAWAVLVAPYVIALFMFSAMLNAFAGKIPQN